MDTNNNPVSPQQVPDSAYANSQQIPNQQYVSPQQIPNSQVPNSQYQPTGYPSSGYPNTGLPKKRSLAIPLAIAIGAIVIVAVIVIALVLSKNNQQNQMMPPPPPPPGTQLDYSAYSQFEADGRKFIIDGEEITIPRKMLDMNDFSYISVQDFASVFGFNTVLDLGTKQITVSKDNISATISDGLKNMVVTKDGKSETVMLESVPLIFSSNHAYIPFRGFKQILDLKSIEWDEKENKIIVETNSIKPVTNKVQDTTPNVIMPPPPPGGPGMMPPQGGQQMAPPQGAQQGGQQMAPPQGGQQAPPPQK